MKIIIVNNGTKNLRLLKHLAFKSFGSCEVVDWSNLMDVDWSRYDLVVLSGSSKLSVLFDKESLKEEIKFIKQTKLPVIGICFGCELVAFAFGAKLAQLERKRRGLVSLKLNDQTLLPDSDEVHVFESHRWVIEKAGRHFDILASSSSGVEIIKHTKRKVYGMQFHPEKFCNHAEGDEIFVNIARMAMK
jgi:GMP synthase-like glutamine amidotransferase